MEQPSKPIVEESQEQLNNNRPWLFQKGKSGNPGGRPKGTKSLKTRAREYLEGLSDEEAVDYFNGLNKLDVWKMGEGNPVTKLQGDSDNPITLIVKNVNGNSNTPQLPTENISTDSTGSTPTV